MPKFSVTASYTFEYLIEAEDKAEAWDKLLKGEYLDSELHNIPLVEWAVSDGEVKEINEVEDDYKISYHYG
jgi:hypothetical protein